MARPSALQNYLLLFAAGVPERYNKHAAGEAKCNTSKFLFHHFLCHPWCQSYLLPTLYTIHTCNTHLFCICLALWGQIIHFSFSFWIICFRRHDPLLPSTVTSHENHKYPTKKKNNTTTSLQESGTLSLLQYPFPALTMSNAITLHFKQQTMFLTHFL